MIAPVSLICLVMVLVMTLAWAVQRRVANGGWVDVFWSFGTGLCGVSVVLLAAADGALWRRALVAALVAIWSVRLGGYIAGRVAHGPEDVRYAALRRQWGEEFNRRLLRFVLIQAPVSATLGLAVLCAARRPDQAFGLLDVAGLSMAFLAVIGEAVADRQMKRFKADSANRGKVCDRGLWGLSRHPNYFFEAIFWVAFPILGTTFENPWSLLSWLAPLVMGAALRYGSGVPPLEAAMIESRGDAYRDYQRRVPALIPRWPAYQGRRI